MVCYCAQTVYFLTGTRKKFPKLSEDSLPRVSVIVAAKDEEANILRCLQALDKLEYPDGRLEIIIVDDNSSDGTGKIIDGFIADKPRFRKIISGDGTANLKGKANALATAVREAGNEIILTTDADCAVNPLWARTIASYYADGVGMVNGFTCQEGEGKFSGMQSLDFIYLLTAASGTANHNKPVSCIGNNMSYRKSAYLDAGGYEGLPFSVTEDYSLMAAIRLTGKHRIIYPLDSGALVSSLPCGSVKELYRQKHRWAVGGLNAPLYGFIIMATAWLAAVCCILSAVYCSPSAGWLIFIKVLFDYMNLRLVSEKLGLRVKMENFLSFEIYYIVYVLLLPLTLLLSRRVIWKGRSY